MLRNWFTVAFRSMLRSPGFSAINIVGLAVGLASCLLILLHVRDELGFDRWIPDGDRVYRVHSTYTIPGRSDFRTVRSAGRMKDALLAAYPATLESGVRLTRFNTTVTAGTEPFSQPIIFADPNALEFFGLRLLRGDPATALADPSGVVLTPEAARRFFGTDDVMGRTLTVCCVGPQRYEYRVTGILEPLPDASHLAIEMMAPIVPERFAPFPNILDTWTSVNVFTYLKLAPGASIQELRSDNPRFIDRHIPPGDGPDARAPSDSVKQEFVNVRDIRLFTKDQAGDIGDLRESGDWALVAGLGIVAALILALGCINFVNMAIARSTLRAREVAVRKVLGAGRRQVMAQFLGESVLLTLVSAVLALGLVELFLPAFNDLLGKELALDLGGWRDWAALAALLLAVGVFGGLYPALHVSRFRPAGILKGEQDRNLGGASGLRTTLVVLQFAIAIGLMTVTSVVYHQTLFASQAHLGFDRDGVVVLRGLGGAVPEAQRNAFIEAVRRMPEVKAASLSSDVPTDNRENNTGFKRTDQPDRAFGINYLSFDYGMLELYGVRPVAGRTFDPAFGTDTVRRPPQDDRSQQNATVILNEAGVRLLGYESAAEAVGGTLEATFFQNVPYRLTIVGVIPDIRFRSLKHDIQPTIVFNLPQFFNSLSVRVDADDPAAFLDRLNRVWRSHIPDLPFNARYLDDMIEGQYRTERVQATAFATFSGLAILIACLGLYGLSAFAAERRTKEIGIRKVFGATVGHIVRLLVWQFSRPVLLANLIAWPAAWWFLSGWLEGFDRRIELTPIYFLAAALLALAIAWITVAGHAARVAARRPIHALRYE